MGNKLIDIEKDIKSKEYIFRLYFEGNLNREILDFINTLRKYASVYLFSGIIRDFFVDNKAPFRDIDLVYDADDNINIEHLFTNYRFEKNSFGGYKIFADSYIIDIWNLNETWGLKKGQLTFKFNYLHKLPDTTFFNFSSIIYSLNEYKFIVGKSFLNFLEKKEIDLVMEENPFPELCIVNTMYYQKKLNYKLSERLKEYILKIKNKILINELLDAQIKHFDEILFKEDEINDFFFSLKKESYKQINDHQI